MCLLPAFFLFLKYIIRSFDERTGISLVFSRDFLNAFAHIGWTSVPIIPEISFPGEMHFIRA